MKRPTIIYRILLSLLVMVALLSLARAQQGGCVLKDIAVKIDFGSGDDVQFANASSLPNYEQIWGGCPTDGHYTFTSYTSDCFEGDWHTLGQDHTPGDKNGNMLLVNAYPGGGVFFNRVVGGLKGSKTYELSLWLINVCRLHICCSNLSPTISIMLTTPAGKKVAAFRLGELAQRTDPQWRKSVCYFTMPPGETAIVLSMQDNAIGGCGNDFALDDIVFRECVPIQPNVVKIIPKKAEPPVVKKSTATPAPILKKELVVKKEPVKQPEKQPEQPKLRQEQVKTTPKATPVVVSRKDTLKLSVPRSKPTIPVPPVLRSRANPLIKQIETVAGEVTITLYDNGEIDGDTVSIYHNNALVVSKARLTQKPITFKVKVDPEKPYHELIMVADNLGSIPPNTSLMIVDANEARYKVFISSTEQKNAKVVLVMKE